MTVLAPKIKNIVYLINCMYYLFFINLYLIYLLSIKWCQLHLLKAKKTYIYDSK